MATEEKSMGPFGYYPPCTFNKYIYAVLMTNKEIVASYDTEHRNCLHPKFRKSKTCENRSSVGKDGLADAPGDGDRITCKRNAPK
ncbi:hypothetical protein CEXT_53971 [Caerostris extrusa]|uniref:Uncharacterized protein n=1 Tax=Caerostris extrusa TaxID=172846 RepID=A0AAV4TQ11_CAEEX|nr:hypothetical protein CEXT_53971 [Caerostris extrusa]